MFYLTYRKSTCTFHRSHWIIHDGQSHYFAEFENEEQLKFFAETIGFTYTLREVKEYVGCEPLYFFDVSKDIVEPRDGGFWNLNELPFGVKPIKALSNGSIVTCYYRNVKTFIEFYRPNPNATAVYHPLPMQDHLAHVRTYGLY